MPISLFVPEDHYLTPLQQFVLTKRQGTIWRGQALLEAVENKSDYLVKWQMSPACLLRLKLCVDLDFAGGQVQAPTELTGSLGVPLWKSVVTPSCIGPAGVELTNISGKIGGYLLSMAAPDILSVPSPLELQAVSLGVMPGDGQITQWSGSMSWPGGKVMYSDQNGSPQVRQFSSFRGEFKQTKDNMTLLLDDEQGRPQFGLEIMPENWQFSAAVYPSVAEQLRLLPDHFDGDYKQPMLQMSQRVADLFCPQTLAE